MMALARPGRSSWHDQGEPRWHLKYRQPADDQPRRRAVHRWNEAFLRPGPRRRGSGSGDNCLIFWGMAETASAARRWPTSCRSMPRKIARRRRRRLPAAGAGSTASFRSARLGPGGELLTRPLVFDGGNLAINASTSRSRAPHPGMEVQVWRAAVGYALADCHG